MTTHYFHLTCTVVLLGALHIALPSWGATDALSLADAQKLAVERSRQLNAQDAAVAASRDMAIAAEQLPAPVLKVGIDNLPISGADQFSLSRDFMTMRRIGLVQEMTRADKRQLKSALFTHEAEKLLAEKNVLIAGIVRDTALAWLDRYYAEAMLSVLAEQTQQVQREIDAAQSAYRSGRGNQADVLAAQSLAIMVEDRASEIERRLRSAKTALLRLVGDVAETPLAGLPDVNTVRWPVGAVASHLAAHPEVVVSSRAVDIAATEARLAQANKQADWSWELAFQQRGSAYSNMVSVGVSIPLQWNQKNLYDREVAAKLARLEEARARRDEVLRIYMAEVQTMVDEWENARQRHNRYQHDLLPLLEERRQALLTAYRGGRSSLVEVLAAQRSEMETKLQALQLALEMARLWAQINFILPTEVVQ